MPKFFGFGYLDAHPETTDNRCCSYSRYTPDDDDLSSSARNDIFIQTEESAVQLYHTCSNGKFHNKIFETVKYTKST